MLWPDIIIALLVIGFACSAFYALPISFFLIFVILAIGTVIFLFIAEKFLALKRKVFVVFESLHIVDNLKHVKHYIISRLTEYVRQWSNAFPYSIWSKNRVINFMLNLLVYGIFWALILYCMIVIVLHLAVGIFFGVAGLCFIMLVGYILLFIHDLF